jgi:hypothetical protein
LLLPPVSLTVSKDLLDRAVLALFGASLVDLVAVPVVYVTELLTKPAVGRHDLEIAVLDREVARCLVKVPEVIVLHG